jgi:hypothetical protein
MSAVNIICQPRHGCLHIVTDSASYVDGIVDGLGCPKVLTVPAWPGAITGRGPALAGAIVGETLSCKFPTFDEAVAGAEEVLPGILERFSDIFSTPYPDRLQVVIAGWSSERRQPESYVFNASEAAAPGATQEEIEANAHYLVGSKLVRLSNAISAPVLSEKITKESGFAGFDVDASPEEVIKALRITIEAQRHDEHPGLDRHYIGGSAQLTTITPAGVQQRILTRWKEDKIGELIRPRPIDWAKWRAELEGPPAGLSRLKRQMMEKKLAKGKLRAA